MNHSQKNNKINIFGTLGSVTAFILVWIILLYITLVLFSTNVLGSQTIQTIALELLVGLFIIVAGYKVLPIFFSNQHLQYILQLKDGHGFKDLTPEEQTKFAALMETYYYKESIWVYPITLLGSGVLMYGIASYPNERLFIAIGLGILLASFLYLSSFSYSKRKITRLIEQEQKDLTLHDKKFKILLLDPIRNTLLTGDDEPGND